jgi:hypothetical protein
MQPGQGRRACLVAEASRRVSRRAVSDSVFPGAGYILYAWQSSGTYRQLCVALCVKTHPADLGLRTSSRPDCRPVPHAVTSAQRLPARHRTGRMRDCAGSRQVRAIAEARAAGLVLLVNAQWQGGQAISDFGVGPWRRRTEAFVASFVEVYSLRQFRIFGDNVRRARAGLRALRRARRRRPSSEGCLIMLLWQNSMRQSGVNLQGVASTTKARCVHVWQVPGFEQSLQGASTAVRQTLDCCAVMVRGGSDRFGRMCMPPGHLPDSQ